jgi:hypothetical protein
MIDVFYQNKLELLTDEELESYLTFVTDSEVKIDGLTVSCEGMDAELDSRKELIAFAKGIVFCRDIDGEFQSKENRNL